MIQQPNSKCFADIFLICCHASEEYWYDQIENSEKHVMFSKVLFLHVVYTPLLISLRVWKNRVYFQKCFADMLCTLLIKSRVWKNMTYFQRCISNMMFMFLIKLTTLGKTTNILKLHFKYSCHPYFEPNWDFGKTNFKKNVFLLCCSYFRRITQFKLL